MKKHWGFAILLSLPIFFFYASHYSNAGVDDPLIATGFIQTDQVSYMANAKEYGERGGFSLQYPLPFSMDYNNEAIYFQPQLFILGATVYTDFRPVFAHRFNTVDWRGKVKLQDDFVQDCLVGDKLKGKRVVVVYDMWNETNCMENGLEELYRNERYRAYRGVH